jgi:ribosome-associated protein
MKATKDLLRAAGQALEDKKGEDIVVLDLSGIASFTDYFVMVTGRNTRQTQALADAVVERMKAEGLRVDHVEGYSGGEWILLDYGAFVVHIFVPAHRDFYGLERLWADAGRFNLQPPHADPETPALPARRAPRRSRNGGSKTSRK